MRVARYEKREDRSAFSPWGAKEFAAKWTTIDVPADPRRVSKQARYDKRGFYGKQIDIAKRIKRLGKVS